MNLIDTDELVEALDEAIKGQTDLRKQLLVGFAKEILSDAPTVEAIPIEWVKRWAMKSENTYNREQIVEMLNEWEKENEMR